VRLTGCSLRCAWCDTAYAFHEGEERSLEWVLERVRSHGVKLVEVTGGEPLEQEGVYPLMESLLAEGHRVMLETSGAVDLSRVPKEVVKIMDIKCPGSGEAGRNLWENLARLAPGRDEVKFVIRDREDYEFARDESRRHNLLGVFNLLFSPVHGELDPAELAGWITGDRLAVRMQLQMHKYVWPGEAKGR
jgi:7-carboxy-7-deazaguanine synthase